MSEQMQQTDFKVRLVVAKEGRSAYISHLDTMRTLQRALARADLALKHTGGFHQRVFLSLVRPLSLGYESDGELCDIVLANRCDLTELPARLNAVLPEGLSVKLASENAVNGREIQWTRYEIFVWLPEPAEENWPERLLALWLAPDFSVQKRNKKGVYQEAQVADMIRSLTLSETSEKNVLRMDAVLKDGPDGSLNPAYLFAAAQEKLGFEPAFVRTRRKGFFGEDGRQIS